MDRGAEMLKPKKLYKEMRHIIEVSTIPATGVVVESVQFSQEVRRVIAHTAKYLLGELNRDTQRLYPCIMTTFICWNEQSRIPASFIRNAIRVLDLRIQHCKELLNDGEWVQDGFSQPFVQGIIEAKDYPNYRRIMSDVVFATHHSSSTMELMLATRQILVDSLITITSEFE